MMAPDTVETARLRGERLAFRHWDIWRGMGTDARVMATLGGIWTEAQAREKLEWNCRHWEQNGHGQWLFFMKDDSRFVGRCGIRKMIVNAKEEVELGYSVMPELWGQGIAPEMGVAALHLDLFEQPGKKRVFQRPAKRWAYRECGNCEMTVGRTCDGDADLRELTGKGLAAVRGFPYEPGLGVGHPLVFGGGFEYVGWRVAGRLLVPRRAANLPVDILAAGCGGGLCEAEISVSKRGA